MQHAGFFFFSQSETTIQIDMHPWKCVETDYVQLCHNETKFQNIFPKNVASQKFQK